MAKSDIKEIDITITPPSKTVLKQALTSGAYKITDLFNKSGEQYRELGMKDKIKNLSEAQMLELLSKNGRLVKRPIVTDGKVVTVGFKEDVFRRVWG